MHTGKIPAEKVHDVKLCAGFICYSAAKPENVGKFYSADLGFRLQIKDLAKEAEKV